MIKVFSFSKFLLIYQNYKNHYRKKLIYVRYQICKEAKQEFVQFFEGNFPRGYKGKVSFQVKGATQPVTLNLGINTFRTAEAGGLKIIKGIPEALLKEVQAPKILERK
jgi:hypothetical protein